MSWSGDQAPYLLDLLAIILACTAFSVIRNRARKALPPGPPGLPLVGNVLDIPTEKSWVAFRDMALKYGDVVSLHALGQTIVILSSMNAAVDLLEKRSAIYSDRQPSVLIDMLGWSWNFALKRYGEEWRRTRRLFWKHFQPNVVATYWSAQQSEARRLLCTLLEDRSGELDDLIKLSLSTTILTAVHGIPADEVTRRFPDILTQADEGISEAFTPGAFLVEFLPWLRHVPPWFPGTGWQKRVAEWRLIVCAMCEEPYAAARDAMRRGVAQRSMLSKVLESSPQLDSEAERTLKEATSVAFGAGVDTSTGTLVAFFCAMILHPEVQKRAQAELDAVVGPDRLPEHADRASLPYVNATVKELLRWHIVAPMGVAHRCMAEDEYRGWRIPKGAIILPAAWAMLHDPEAFPDPEDFRPERFLRDGQLRTDVLDPSLVTFGFGRRICPGRHFADDALFINVATILHALDIVPALDERGQPIAVKAHMTSGLLSYVEPFKFSIRPRSEGSERLIREAGNN